MKYAIIPSNQDIRCPIFNFSATIRNRDIANSEVDCYVCVTMSPTWLSVPYLRSEYNVMVS